MNTNERFISPLLQKDKAEITDEELYYIVCHSEGLSGAEILNVVINAATFSLNREGIQCQVRLQDFELAIEGVKKAKMANCQV